MKYVKPLIGIGLLAGLGGCGPSPQTAEPQTDPGHTQAQSVPSTKADNVLVLDQQFDFPEGTPRRVWIYLPPDYQTSSQSYPVVYMHDGQNLFDAATSYVGEWQVDETLNQLAEQGAQVPLVVGIDHGGESRMNELSPWPNEQFGEARGEAYLDFLLNQVKPYIDQHYRTRPDAGNTAVMGSSMGGLMSHYAVVAHPEVFAKAAVFSPSFWYSQQAYYFTEAHPLPSSHKVYYLVGSEEGRDMVNGMTNMTALIAAQQHPDAHLHESIVAGANHNEAFWSSQLADALIWLGMVDLLNETH